MLDLQVKRDLTVGHFLINPPMGLAWKESPHFVANTTNILLYLADFVNSGFNQNWNSVKS